MLYFVVCTKLESRSRRKCTCYQKLHSNEMFISPPPPPPPLVYGQVAFTINIERERERERGMDEKKYSTHSFTLVSIKKIANIFTVDK